jgi:protein-L-isoaspartate(D-aspartate) O-methyltransferase
MTHNIDPKPGMKVLEIGTGSGYQAAVLSFMTDQVYTIEIKPGLFGVTDAIYRKLEQDYPTYRNVRRKNADGYYGWEEYAPFDRIIVTCGIDHIPPALLKQLSPDGIMVIPVGPMNGEQVILKITKRIAADGTVSLEREDIYGGKVVQAFVPFTASDGSWHQQKK